MDGKIGLIIDAARNVVTRPDDEYLLGRLGNLIKEYDLEQRTQNLRAVNGILPKPEPKGESCGPGPLAWSMARYYPEQPFISPFPWPMRVF